MKKLILSTIISGMAFASNATIAPIMQVTSIDNSNTKQQLGLKVIISQNIKNNFGIDEEITFTSGKIGSSTTTYEFNTYMYQLALMPTFTFNIKNISTKIKLGAEYTMCYLKGNITGYDDYYRLTGLNPKIAIESSYKNYLFGIAYSYGNVIFDWDDDYIKYSQGSLYIGYTF